MMSELLARYGIRFPRNKRKFNVLCPRHNDRAPSLSVDLDKDVWYCFACGVGGNARQFAIFVEGNPVVVSNRPNARRRIEKDIVILHVPERELRKGEQGIAFRYLASRGILPSTARAFGVLYGNEACRSSPLLAPFEGYCLVPLYRRNGFIGQLYGRAVSPDTKPAHRYVSGLALDDVAPFWPRSKTVVVAESVIDAMALYEFGIHSVIPLYGANNFRHLYHLRRGTKLLLALDRDDAGRKAQERIAAEISGRYIVKSIDPDMAYKDFAELAERGTQEERERIVAQIKKGVMGLLESHHPVSRRDQTVTPQPFFTMYGWDGNMSNAFLK